MESSDRCGNRHRSYGGQNTHDRSDRGAGNEKYTTRYERIGRAVIDTERCLTTISASRSAYTRARHSFWDRRDLLPLYLSSTP